MLIGAATFRRLPSGTVAERLPPLQVKGKEEAIEAYVLHSVGPSVPGSNEAREVPSADSRDDGPSAA